MVELDGDDGPSISFPLREAVGERPAAILARAIAERYDAAWVRARIPQVFGFVPDAADGEKSLLDIGFVAVKADSLVGTPFICSDHYGRTGILFSPAGPDQATQAEIAGSFWSLLLRDPEDLADFDTKVYHLGAGVWLHFGCTDGEPFCEEEPDE
jgi:hypothetical protein